MDNSNIIKFSNRFKSSQCQHNENNTNYRDEHIYCSFCGRESSKVLKMVKGPGVNICSECVMIAVQYLVLHNSMPSEEAQKILDAFWGSDNNIG